MKKILKIVLVSIITIILSAMTGLFLNTISFSINSDVYSQREEKAIELLSTEGKYPELFKWATSNLDNVTDFVIITTSTYSGSETPIEKALLDYRWNNTDPIDDIEIYYANKDNSKYIVEYPRYWHGYLPILRVLLLIFNYGTIRIINFILQILLVILVMFLLFKRDKRLVIPFLLLYFILMPIVLGKCLQYSSCFYVIIISSIIVIKCKPKNLWYIFLLTGILTSYFDLLTYPLATLGIPLVLFISLNKCDTLKEYIKILVIASLGWCIGYLGMWFCKWLLVTVFTETNLIADAINQIFYRMGSTKKGNQNVDVVKMILFNVFSILKNPASILGILSCVLLLVIKRKQIRLAEIVPFLLISLLPFIWYLVVKNHSDLHTFMTHKILAISLFAMMCYCSMLLPEGRKQVQPEEQLNK